MTQDAPWAHVHDRDKSWRTKLIGGLSIQYVVPRYVEWFESYFKIQAKMSFLELGSGTGEVACAIRDKKFDFIKDYKVSENFAEGVEWLRGQSLDAVRANAEQVPFNDASFDAVVCFDVMHHVSNPAQMAREMLRTARGRLFLIESNGLSLGRKLLELTPGHRRAGERSYSSWKYKSFFQQPGYRLTRWEIHPFVMPLRAPAALLEWEIRLNRWIEHVPFLNWQCSNVAIYLEYERTPSQS